MRSRLYNLAGRTPHRSPLQKNKLHNLIKRPPGSSCVYFSGRSMGRRSPITAACSSHHTLARVTHSNIHNSSCRSLIDHTSASQLHTTFSGSAPQDSKHLSTQTASASQRLVVFYWAWKVGLSYSPYQLSLRRESLVGRIYGLPFL